MDWVLRDMNIPEKKPPLISLSVIEVCWECCGAYLGGADPINHSPLHHFRYILAVHLPYSEDPRGALPTPPYLGLWSPGAVSSCQSVVSCFPTPLPPSVSSPLQSRLCVHLLPPPFSIEKALTASSVWHVLMITELPLSAKCDNFIIPHLHFQAVFPFQHKRQVVTCFSAALTMDSVVTVFCNRSDESTSCLQEMKKQGWYTAN